MSATKDIADSVEFLEAHGFAVVPREPTEEILLAILMAQFLNDTRETYAAILAAAPQATP